VNIDNILIYTIYQSSISILEYNYNNTAMNKYEIIGIVGEGAYGIVYKAKNKETGDIGKK
jgi:hypothetical protein